MRKAGAMTLLAAAALAVAPVARAQVVHPGQVNYDWTLGLIGHSIPAELKTAKADPYAAPAAPACETIPREIAALDEVLGPDADEPAVHVKMTARAESLVFQGVRTMIPHKDVVRFVTGANRKDKALNEAAMAGWARRGFLKGMEVNLGCAAHLAPAPTVVATTGAAIETAAIASPSPTAIVASPTIALVAGRPREAAVPAVITPAALSLSATSPTYPDAALSR